METVGLSPKAVAAGITAYLAPIIVGFLAEKFGADIEVSTVTALLGPLLLAAATFAAAAIAGPGTIDVNAGEPNDELLREVPDDDKPPLEAA